MPSQNWTNLIEKNETFSDGALVTTSTEQWNRGTLIPKAIADEAITRISWKEENEEFGTFVFSSQFTQGADIKSTIPRYILNRILCHIIISRMPDEGLPELIDAAKNVLEFYRDRSISSHTPMIETSSSIQAKIGSRYERESFSYDEM